MMKVVAKRCVLVNPAVWTDHSSSVEWRKVFGSDVFFIFGIFQHIGDCGDPFVFRQVKMVKLYETMHLCPINVKHILPY